MLGTLKMKAAVSPKLLVTICQCAQHHFHGDFTLTIHHSQNLKHFKCCTLSIFILSITSYAVAQNQKFALCKEHLSNLYNPFTLKLQWCLSYAWVHFNHIKQLQKSTKSLWIVIGEQNFSVLNLLKMSPFKTNTFTVTFKHRNIVLLTSKAQYSCTCYKEQSPWVLSRLNIT